MSLDSETPAAIRYTDATVTAKDPDKTLDLSLEARANSEIFGQRFEEVIKANSCIVKFGENGELQIAPRIGRDATPVEYRYIKIRDLGKGGYGTVALFQDKKLGKDVAIKSFDASEVGVNWRSEVVRLFEEASVLGKAALSHMVQVYDCLAGEDDAGNIVAYMVMQNIPHPTLWRYLNENKALAVEKIVDIAINLGVDLDRLYEMGLRHGDIKPENIFINPEDTSQVWMTDPGFVGSGENSPFTMTYVAPEVLGNRRNLNIRSEVYSLGCVLFRAAFGDRHYTYDPVYRSVYEHERPSQRARKERPVYESPMKRSQEEQELMAARVGGMENLKKFSAFFDRALEFDQDKRFKNCEDMAVAYRDVARECALYK